MLVVGAGQNQYAVNNSLRFRSSASAYLSRTPSVSSNRRTWTWSAWVKRGTLGANQVLFGAGLNNGVASDELVSIYFNASDQLGNYVVETGVADRNNVSSAVYRDPSAWYHIVAIYDSTQATASQRQRLFVNGVEITTWSATSYVSQNYQPSVNSSAYPHAIGKYGFNATRFFDGYLAEINFIDGQALTPSSFGANAGPGNTWLPIRYAGTYGTNGFYLPFSDTSALTTSSNVGLGKDFSGNTNYWTTNNISITAGATYDAMKDSPTLSSATVANYAVLNPLFISGTYSNANLKYNASSTTNATLSTIAIPTSGQFYAEATLTGTPFGNAQTNAYAYFGITPTSRISGTSAFTDGNGLFVSDAGWRYNFVAYPSGTNLGSAFANGDVIGLAVDTSANTFTFYKNGSSIYSGTIGIASGTQLSFMANNYDGSYGAMTINFGQQGFKYTPPSGYVALNTYNLPTPSLPQGNRYMDATTYTGNTTTITATNAGSFKPDLVWIKDRTQVAQHVLTDSVRGTSAQLFSSLTNAEQTNSTYVTSFNSNGFTVGVGNSGTGVVNNSGDNFVGWQWQAGQGTTSSNTSGTIPSTVSVNPSAGFSVVTYVGSGINATVGHGLGVAPSMVIVKNRSTALDWLVGHTSLTSWAYNIYLNLTSGQSNNPTAWNSTAPTSSVFSVGTWNATNGSANPMVAYCWAAVPGFSAFGSYTGNGSADGPFVYLGFRPKFILWKRTDTTGSWYLYDTARSQYNASVAELYPNLSNAEGTSTTGIDILSNGWKIRTSGASDPQVNASGGTYIYMAFAENPFKYASAR